jgi:hypothetical protein
VVLLAANPSMPHTGPTVAVVCGDVAQWSSSSVVSGWRFWYSCSDVSGNSLDGAIDPSIGKLVDLVRM